MTRHFIGSAGAVHRPFTKQVPKQLDFWTYPKESAACKSDVCVLPKQLDEQGSTFQLPASSAMLAVFAEKYVIALLSSQKALAVPGLPLVETAR